jgi:hypothetical protein
MRPLTPLALSLSKGLPFALSLSKGPLTSPYSMTSQGPFALSLSKCRPERLAGFDKLSPNGFREGFDKLSPNGLWQPERFVFA